MAVRNKNIEETNQLSQMKNSKQEKNSQEKVHESIEFIGLTYSTELDQEEEDSLHFEENYTSTHDLAEIMLYSFVDNSPHVADLLWTKQLTNQGDFLKLTDEQDWSDLPFIDFSTHEPLC